MPPFVSRKRQQSSPAEEETPPKKRRILKVDNPRPTVFDTLDTQPTIKRTPKETKAYINSLQDEDNDESSLSDINSDEFEDVLPQPPKKKTDADTDTDEDMDWEDAIPEEGAAESREHHEPSEMLNIILSRPDEMEATASVALGKKGPSKKERVLRVQTHCMHVSFLLWHNSIRNSWINDKGVQEILTSGLSDGMKAEVAKWRTAMGFSKSLTLENGNVKNVKNAKGKGSRKAKGEGKMENERERVRDWGAEAAKLEEGVPNLSRGDPILRLLKYLTAYWKKRFRVTQPGLRKLGYRSAFHLHEEVRSFQSDPHDPARHGEKISDLEDFKQCAKNCEGSRDVGAQLFTALLRGLGIEARLVCSLQPTGFGWSKSEEAKPRKPNSTPMENEDQAEAGYSKVDEDSNASEPSGVKLKTKSSGKSIPKATPKQAAKTRSLRGTNSAPINVDDSDSELSSVPDINSEVSDDEVDPSKLASKLASKPIDKDLKFPIYWTEVLSPISNKYHSVSTMVNPNVATAPEHYAAYEPRGVAAEKAKQVLCYITAFSSDGTAKDVTVRYLKRHQLPGKTKGFRLPAEKVPIYNKRGKILKYENYDWFTHVMSFYARSSEKRTTADDLEEHGDLVPFKAEKTAKDGTDEKGVETLQGYKTSAEFVLPRHLRREEAILPNAKIVKYFTSGKGDKATTEAVYRRKDVVTCKTVESWHKEGRQIVTGEQAVKHVPIRAVTIVRKREIEDSTRETGEKPTQGLYSKAQTEWIIPPPIKDGKIPRNAFGNIDVYVPSMVPRGSVHVRLKGTAKLCKRLGIDFAEACTGFEFGKQRAVPVLTGVVVAEEHENILRDAWRTEEKIKKEKEDLKRTAGALALWKKFMYGLRIVKRMEAEYGAGEGIPDEANPFTKKQNGRATALYNSVEADQDENDHFDAPSDGGGGGFLLPGQELEVEDPVGGGFLPESEEEEEEEASSNARELEIDHGDSGQSKQKRLPTKSHSAAAERTYPDTPISLQSAHKSLAKAADMGELEADGQAADEAEMESSASISSEDESDSEDYAPTKRKRGSNRGRSGRASGRSEIASNTRPKRRGVVSSSPYFEKRRK